MSARMAASGGCLGLGLGLGLGAWVRGPVEPRPVHWQTRWLT